jgi:hypothetical protein
MLRVPRQLPFIGLTIWLAIKIATAAGMVVPLAMLQMIPRAADTPLLGALDVAGACMLLLLQFSGSHLHAGRWALALGFAVLAQAALGRPDSAMRSLGEAGLILGFAIVVASELGGLAALLPQTQDDGPRRSA